MPTPERIVNVREIVGIDRNKGSRLANPGSWYATQNMVAFEPGLLQKRPGSTVIIDGRNPRTNSVTWAAQTNPNQSWAGTTPYLYGALINQKSGNTNQRWVCITPGSSSGVEPSWPGSPTQGVTTQSDGTVTWLAGATTYSTNGISAIPSIYTFPPTNVFNLASTNLMPGQALSHPLSTQVTQNQFATYPTKLLGARRIRPSISLNPTPPRQIAQATTNSVNINYDIAYNTVGGSALVQPGVFPVATGIMRVAGMYRFYGGNGGRTTIGAYNFHGGQKDQLFFLTYATSGTNWRSIVIPEWDAVDNAFIQGQTGITTHGADWFFCAMQNHANPSTPNMTPNQGYWAVATNQVDPPLWLGSTSTNTINGVPIPSIIAGPLSVIRSDQQGDLSTSVGSATIQGLASTSTDLQLCGVRSLCMYAGATVWGGYNLQAPATTTGNPNNYQNFITFSDVGAPQSLATTNGIISNIQIGLTDSEVVTAVETNCVPTDVMGLKGQLVVFTGRRVVIFDGVPPQSQNPTGVNFHSVVFDTIGCNAPRTVVKTDKGLVFLGSDGFVYLIPINSMVPIKVGNAIWQVFRGMSPRTQKQCAAFWNPRGFYCISYPEPGVHADTNYNSIKPAYFGALDQPMTSSPVNVEADVPNRHLWGDLRPWGVPNSDPSIQMKDFGIKWFGPHTNMKHSCFVVALGEEDKQEMFAGSAVDGSIFQIALENWVSDPDPSDLFYQWTANTPYAVGAIIRPNAPTSQQNQRWVCTTAGTSAASEPAWPASPTAAQTLQADGTVTWTSSPYINGTWAGIPIDILGVTGLYDMGDANVDKVFTAFNVAIGTDRPTTLLSSMLVTPGDAGTTQAEQDFTDNVTATGDVLGTTFTAGSSLAAPGDNVVTYAHRPPKRARGKMFRMVFRENPLAGAKMFLSDLHFRANIIPRRK